MLSVGYSYIQDLIQIKGWTQYGHEIKNSWGQIRTVDLSGMSRTLSPTELPSHAIFYLIVNLLCRPHGYEPNALAS